MQRWNINFQESHLQILKQFNDISLSEHVRRALDEYVKTLQPISSSSLSKLQSPGGSHGE